MKSDLENRGHICVHFDAWRNDIGEDAGVLLMAAMSEAITITLKRTSAPGIVKEALSTTLKNAIKSMRRALLPASKVVGQALLRKAVGTAIDDLADAISGGEIDLSADSDGDSVLDRGLDAFFEKALESHKQRDLAIQEFQEFLQSAISSLETIDGQVMPIFVFVDELDRCRPTYAIKLLEEIKHLLGVEKICFVISTNNQQLAESIRAVYGQGFDGPSYLRRFFDRTFTLPKPNFRQFAEFLTASDPLPGEITTTTGLPRQPVDYEDDAAFAFAFTAEAFDLDLRAQQHVYDLFVTVCGAAIDKRLIVDVWTIFLCACHYRRPDIFEKIYSKAISAGELAETLKDELRFDPEITYRIGHEVHPHRVTHENRTSKYSEVVSELHKYASPTTKAVREGFNGLRDTGTVEERILQILMDDLQKVGAKAETTPLLHRMTELVRHSGLVTT